MIIVAITEWRCVQELKDRAKLAEQYHDADQDGLTLHNIFKQVGLLAQQSD